MINNATLYIFVCLKKDRLLKRLVILGHLGHVIFGIAHLVFALLDLNETNAHYIIANKENL